MATQPVDYSEEGVTSQERRFSGSLSGWLMLVPMVAGLISSLPLTTR